MIKHAAILHQGILYQGKKRHRDLIEDAKPFDISKGVQGFVTTNGMFVNRKEAAKIALAARQLKRPKQSLNSEDLY